MPALRVGDVVPDCTLLLPDGGSAPLSSFASDALLVVFLRHLT